MRPLVQFDELFIRNRLPREVRDLLVKHGASNTMIQPFNDGENIVFAREKSSASLFLAGGFIRSAIAREEVNDVDLFASTKVLANEVANELADLHKVRVYSTDNAYTVRAKPCDIQVIHRWTFPSPEQCVESFDYTIARAALWAVRHIAANGEISHATWASTADDDFYSDLAARRLVYRSPVREEEAGGSLLRLLKFYRRNYTAQLDTIAEVMSRLVMKVRPDDIAKTVAFDNLEGKQNTEERQTAKVLLGLLHEVDPNSVTNDPAYTTTEEAMR